MAGHRQTLCRARNAVLGNGLPAAAALRLGDRPTRSPDSPAAGRRPRPLRRPRVTHEVTTVIQRALPTVLSQEMGRAPAHAAHGLRRRGRWAPTSAGPAARSEAATPPGMPSPLAAAPGSPRQRTRDAGRAWAQLGPTRTGGSGLPNFSDVVRGAGSPRAPRFRQPPPGLPQPGAQDAAGSHRHSPAPEVRAARPAEKPQGRPLTGRGSARGPSAVRRCVPGSAGDSLRRRNRRNRASPRGEADVRTQRGRGLWRARPCGWHVATLGRPTLGCSGENAGEVRLLIRTPQGYSLF